VFFKRRAGTRWYDRGDISSVDYTKDTLTTDGTWKDLDISGVVGVGKKLVLIQGYLSENTSRAEFGVRTKGYVNEVNVDSCMTQIGGVGITHCFMVYTNADGVIQYFGENITWVYLNLTIRGWWK